MEMQATDRSLLDFAFQDMPLSEIIESDMMADIITQLALKRAQMGMTQKEFAELLGITQGMLSRYESGVSNFTVKTLARIFGTLDVPVSLNFSLDQKNANVLKRAGTNANWGNVPTYGAEDVEIAS